LIDDEFTTDTSYSKDGVEEEEEKRLA